MQPSFHFAVRPRKRCFQIYESPETGKPTGLSEIVKYHVKLLLTLFAAATLLATSSVPAQGVDVPCPGCENLEYRPLPTSGAWFNPTETGSGFSFEVKDRTFVGYYYGYDELGTPAWYIFSGPLSDPAPESEALWEFEGELLSLSGGACIDCAYIAPTVDPPIGTIRIEFLQPNHARYAIDGGEERFLVPLMFGVNGYAYFEDSTDYLLPELKGDWVAVHKIANPEPFGLRTFAATVFMGNLIENNNPNRPEVDYGLTIFQDVVGSEVLGIANFYCGHLDGETEDPRCEIQLLNQGEDGLPTDPTPYNVPLAYLGPEEFMGEAENGDVLIFKKLDFK